MAVKVNLLPVDKRVGKGLQRILKVTRMLGVIFLGVFIVFSLGVTAFFIFSSIQLNSLNQSNATLTSQISGLETSETQMILLKDRIAKIKTVQKIPGAVKNLDNISPIITALSADSPVSELDVSPAKIAASIDFRSNTDLANFLKTLSASTAFKTVTLTSFSFNPANGYLVTIDITAK